MNANQANNLNFPNVLSRMGFEPVAIRKQGHELWYASPFRAEKEPSFHVSKGKKYQWVWKDFGDEGGGVIDFIMRYHGHRSLKKALDYLKTLYPNELPIFTSNHQNRVGEEASQTTPDLFSFHGQMEKDPEFSPPRQLEFREVHEIHNPLIYDYLCKERAIPRRLVDKYIKEVSYYNRKLDKVLWGFGMKNQSGGYEIRAATDAYSFKSALIKRDVTIIKGSQPHRQSVNVVEGMTDFLSLLAMYNTTQLAGDTIIMHSLSSYNRTADIIRKNSYQHIHTFLDNHTSADKYNERFQKDFGEKVTNESSLFAPHEDLNDALRANQTKHTRMR